MRRVIMRKELGAIIAAAILSLVFVPTVSDRIQVSSSGDHTVGLRSNGTVV
jgi:hypothetical protein